MATTLREKKFPKEPSENASIETWHKYGEKVKAFKKFNAEVRRLKEKKL